MPLRRGMPEEVGMSQARVRAAASLAERLVAQDVTPALVVLAARRGVIVLHEAHGRLTPEPDSPPIGKDAIFPLASISKPITATAVMILVEDALLGLNRPVAEYVPEFVGGAKDSVMVHHLLTHTSGLDDEQVDSYAKESRESVVIPPAESNQHPDIHERLWSTYGAPLAKPPGAEMSYSNYGYDLLGEIVRRISGGSLSEFAERRIFKPLGMKDSSFGVRESSRARLVRRRMDAGYAESVDTMPGLETRRFQQTPLAGGGVYSTAMDLAIFCQMFLDRGRHGETAFLSPASVAEMTRNQIPGVPARYNDEVFPDAGWGLGWDIHGNKKSLREGSLHSPATFSHGGAGGVYVWVDPVYEIVGCYFSIQRHTGIRVSSPLWCADLFLNALTSAVAAV